MNILAQINIAPDGGFTGTKDGKGLLADPGNGIDLFAKFMSSAIGLITIIAIIWFVFKFFIGAIGIISSGGDKQSLESARKNLQYSIIGIIVVVAGIFIVKLIGFLIGIPNLLDIGTLFGNITK